MFKSSYLARRTSVLAFSLGLVLLAQLTNAEDRPFTIGYQNDGIMALCWQETYRLPRWQAIKGLDPARFKAEIDNYADSGVRILSYGTWSVGNSFNHPTEIGRLFGDGIPDDRFTHKLHLQIKHDLATLIERGIDPLGSVVARAKERGMTITAELRANNACPGGTLEEPTLAGPGYNGIIWYEKPEWRLTDPYPDPNGAGQPNPNWDYAKPEVRDYYVRVLTEILDNYDVDGIDVSLYQNPPFFDRAEPDKVGHMTAFIKALRAECDRVGRQRGKPIMLTVIFWETLWGRHYLRDEGIDVGSWARQGLIDRIILITTSVPYGSQTPLCDLRTFVKMMKGTNCRVYAACEQHEPEVHDKLESQFKSMGLDGVFYLNYMVVPGGRHKEYRTLNGSYKAEAMPDKVGTPWERTGAGAGQIRNARLELRGPVVFRRGAEILPMLNRGLTVEAAFSPVAGDTAGLHCGLEAADGRRAARVAVADGRLVLLEGSHEHAAIELDPQADCTVRLTMDSGHRAKVFLNHDETPVMSARLTRKTAAEEISWGHLGVGEDQQPASSWTAVHYTLEGAFPPSKRQF